MSPREFMPRFQAAVPVPAEILMRVTETYYAVRFDGDPATPEMKGEMLAILQTILGAA